MRIRNLVSVLLATTSALAAAHLPFVGKWKMDPLRSDGYDDDIPKA